MTTTILFFVGLICLALLCPKFLFRLCAEYLVDWTRVLRMRGLVTWLLAMTAIIVAIESRADSFNPTNTILPATAIVTYPTNAPGQWTGMPIFMDNQEGGAFFLKGMPWPSVSNANLVVTLITSGASQPHVYTNGNGMITNSDWLDPISGNSSALTLTCPRFSTKDATNYIYWETNLPPEFCRMGAWIGIYSITNASSNAATLNALTNFDAGIKKKVYPVKLGPSSP